MPTGKVKWFNPEKGFGFLAREDGPDVFVHKDALPAGTEELKPGQRVEFGIVAGKRGDQALQVRVLDPLPSVAATDILITKLMELDEHYCDFARLLPFARALREQVDWPLVAGEVAGNDFAVVFLQLLGRLGIVADLAPGERH